MTNFMENPVPINFMEKMEMINYMAVLVPIIFMDKMVMIFSTIGQVLTITMEEKEMIRLFQISAVKKLKAS